MESRPFQQSTSSRKQIDEAGRKVATQREQELNDLRAVLETPEGRRFLWRCMAHCGINKTVFDGHGSRMSYNSGVQDVGHFLMAEIMEARSDAFAQMMAEDQEEKRKNA